MYRATIELYKSKINNMSNYINQAKSAVGDFCVDLSALKSKVLGINSSVCDSVVTSISTSSQTQEQQIAGLEATQDVYKRQALYHSEIHFSAYSDGDSRC